MDLKRFVESKNTFLYKVKFKHSKKEIVTKYQAKKYKIIDIITVEMVSI